MSLFFGLDFGTTTTAFVAYNSETLRSSGFGDSGYPFQSTIILNEITGNVENIGIDAWENIHKFIMNNSYIVIRSIKQALQDNSVWRTNTQNWTAQKLVAEILKYGKDKILKRYPDIEAPVPVVMAIPIDFHYEERGILQKAAEDAGISVKHFISEPTAALVGWRKSRKGTQNIVVFDWGGGTLDISVHAVKKGRIAEL